MFNPKIDDKLTFVLAQHRGDRTLIDGIVVRQYQNLYLCSTPLGLAVVLLMSAGHMGAERPYWISATLYKWHDRAAISALGFSDPEDLRRRSIGCSVKQYHVVDYHVLQELAAA